MPAGVGLVEGCEPQYVRVRQFVDNTLEPYHAWAMASFSVILSGWLPSDTFCQTTANSSDPVLDNGVKRSCKLTSVLTVAQRCHSTGHGAGVV